MWSQEEKKTNATKHEDRATGEMMRVLAKLQLWTFWLPVHATPTMQKILCHELALFPLNPPYPVSNDQKEKVESEETKCGETQCESQADSGSDSAACTTASQCKHHE